MMDKHTHIGQMILRIGLGVLFFGSGLMKLIFPGISGITQMLSGIGIPVAGFFAWILILVELIGGLALISGYLYRVFAILLGIIMIVAIFTVQLKTFAQDFPAQMQFFKDLGILVGLVSITFTGPGCWCLGKNEKPEQKD